MINSKNELKFYIMADRIIAGLNPQKKLLERILTVITPELQIIKYLELMRKASYYGQLKKKSLLYCFISKYFDIRYRNMGKKLGFSIGKDVFGYALFIPHYGTIVVNNGVRAGNYCVLHTSTCIGGDGKLIGNALYLSSGAKIMGRLQMGDFVSVATNSLVNKSVGDNVLVAGLPANIKKEAYQPWYIRDGKEFENRIQKIEQIKKQLLY